MEAKQLSTRDDPRRRAVRRWRNLRGEAKLAWDYLFTVAAGQAATIVVLPADVGSDQGTSDRGGRRALEALAVAGLIEIIDRLAGQWTVYLPDPLDVAKARRARESDDRPTFEFACDEEEARSESSPAEGQRGGTGAAVVSLQPPPRPHDASGEWRVASGESPAPLAGHADESGPPPVSGGGHDGVRVASGEWREKPHVPAGDERVESGETPLATRHSPLTTHRGGSGAGSAAAEVAPDPPRRTYTLTNGESIETSTSSPATGPVHVNEARTSPQRAQVPGGNGRGDRKLGGSGAGSAAGGQKLSGAAAAAVASMLAGGDNLAERSRLADELAELIVDVLSDRDYPPHHAIDVAHAVWIDGDLQAAVVKGILATISTGRTTKGVPIRSRGAFFRETIRNQATKATAAADRHGREVGEALRRCMARGRSK